MSALIPGVAVTALAVGLSAAVAREAAQVQPTAVQVQRHGPPGPALIEKLEASAGSAPPAQEARHAASDEFSTLGEAVSEVCQLASTTAPGTPDALLCALSSRATPLLETLLAGLDESTWPLNAIDAG